MFTKKYLTAVFLFVTAASIAQTIKVTKESVRIKGDNTEGYEVVLDGTVAEVQDQLDKYLKPVGKIRKGDDAASIALPLINGKNYTSPIYVTVRDKGKGAAWIGLRPAEWASNVEEVNREIEKMVYDFAVTFYKSKIQLEIDESMRAMQAVERQQQKLQNQNKDLTNRLADNKNEKIQLEKALENNKVQFEALTKKIELNKQGQDSVARAGEQIKKVIEMQKEKQRKVN